MTMYCEKVLGTLRTLKPQWGRIPNGENFHHFDPNSEFSLTISFLILDHFKIIIFVEYPPVF